MIRNPNASGAFNVLVTSLSRKVPLIREVRRALEKLTGCGQVFGADNDPGCIGRYFVDEFWAMPPTERLGLDDLVKYCHCHGIRAIVPTRDGELLFYADLREDLAHNGIFVMIAPPAAVRICLDKVKFYQTLVSANDVSPIPTLNSAVPGYAESWVVKERYGAGSKHMRLDVSAQAAQSYAKKLMSPVFQPFVNGQEFSVDLYVTKTGLPKGCIVRKRDVVIDGESKVTTTVDRPDIETLSIDASRLIGLTGHILFQVIEDGTGNLNLVECNCRFGGASSLSVAAGLDSFYWFFQECLGDDLAGVPYVKSDSQLRQIRYAEDKIIENA